MTVNDPDLFRSLVEKSPIPCRVQWVEYLVAQQYRIGVRDPRQLCWYNLAVILRKTDTLHLMPERFRRLVAVASEEPPVSLGLPVPLQEP